MKILEEAMAAAESSLAGVQADLNSAQVSNVWMRACCFIGSNAFASFMTLQPHHASHITSCT
jgi:hypothetical protein